MAQDKPFEDLPDLTRLRAEQELATYCARKVPVHVRDRLRITFTRTRSHLTLFEERVRFDGSPGPWTQMPIAQLRFDPATALWKLYCCDRHERWHVYRQAEPAKAIGALLHALDTDTTGIFWG